MSRINDRISSLENTMKLMQLKIDFNQDENNDFKQDRQKLKNFFTENISLPNKYCQFILNCIQNTDIVKLIGMEQLINIYLKLINHRLKIHDEIQRIIESKMPNKTLYISIHDKSNLDHNQNMINTALTLYHFLNQNHIQKPTSNINTESISQPMTNNMDTMDPSLSNPHFLCQTMMTQPDLLK